jgi:transcriptional regulator with XRE-family HTH domain
MSQVTKGVALPAIEDEYEEFLIALGRRIKQLRKERGLSLRDMVVLHGYHESGWRRMERGGAGNVQSLLKIARAFQISLSVLLDGLGEYPTTSIKDVKKHTAKTTKVVKGRPS